MTDFETARKADSPDPKPDRCWIHMAGEVLAISGDRQNATVQFLGDDRTVELPIQNFAPHEASLAIGDSFNCDCDVELSSFEIKGMSAVVIIDPADIMSNEDLEELISNLPTTRDLEQSLKRDDFKT